MRMYTTRFHVNHSVFFWIIIPHEDLEPDHSSVTYTIVLTTRQSIFKLHQTRSICVATKYECLFMRVGVARANPHNPPHMQSFVYLSEPRSYLLRQFPYDHLPAHPPTLLVL
jgi:hypothetical protein